MFKSVLDSFTDSVLITLYEAPLEPIQTFTAQVPEEIEVSSHAINAPPDFTH